MKDAIKDIWNESATLRFSLLLTAVFSLAAIPLGWVWSALMFVLAAVGSWYLYGLEQRINRERKANYGMFLLLSIEDSLETDEQREQWKAILKLHREWLDERVQKLEEKQ